MSFFRRPRFASRPRVVSGFLAGLNVDHVGAAQHFTSAASFNYTGLSTSAGAPNAGILIFIFSTNNDGGPGLGAGIHWDSAGANQAMTLLEDYLSGASGQRITVFGLTGPSAGTGLNCSIPSTTTTEVTVIGISFYGGNPAGLGSMFPTANIATNFGTAAASPATVTNTHTANGHITVAGFTSTQTFPTAGNNSGTTSMHRDGAGTLYGTASSYVKNTTTSATQSWTMTASGDFDAVSIDVSP